MSKHTPGTWSDYYAKLAPVGSVAVWSDQGGMVRRVALCGTHEGIDLDEAEANARLIAAAPDLLEALIQIAKLTGPDSIIHAHDIARAAIEKAEGV